MNKSNKNDFEKERIISQRNNCINNAGKTKNAPINLWKNYVVAVQYEGSMYYVC